MRTLRRMDKFNMPKTRKIFEVSEPVVQCMMSAAQAHREASVVCIEDSHKHYPMTTRTYYLMLASFELLLLSVEQSMKLFVMLYCSHKPKPNHRIKDLLNYIIIKGGNSNRLFREILDSANKIGAPEKISPISEDEVKRTIGRHKSSYTDFRYFGLDTRFNVASLNKQTISGRDQQVMHCMALGLMAVNMQKIEEKGIKIRPLMGVARKVSESEMTDELRALREFLK